MQFLLHNFNYILKLKFAYICPSVCLAICLSIWRHFSSSLINVRSNNKLELPLPGKVKRYEQEVFFLLKNYSNYQKHCKRIRKKFYTRSSHVNKIQYHNIFSFKLAKFIFNIIMKFYACLSTVETTTGKIIYFFT